MPVLDPLLPFAPILDPIFDPLTIRASRALQRYWDGPPLRGRQARCRERALPVLIARHRPAAEALAPAVAAGDVEAIARFDALVASAVATLRGEAERDAARDPVERIAHGVDRVVHAEGEEWLDDPAFDRALRVRTLERLDRMNEALGSHEAFFAAIDPLLDRLRALGVARPTIVDLASGHAGFAVALALHAGAREGRVSVVATDLVDDFLAVGRARARALALDETMLDFRAQDAFDLRSLEAHVGRPVDVVLCTQSLHHFSPGAVARLFAGAVSAARHGVVFVDGERNLFALAMVTVTSALLGRGSLPFLHDSFVSMRRMYTEQELALIAELAPFPKGRPTIERGWHPPGHVFLRVGR
jgi:2-polyprenyl-3-methyl-5-hydroxy-6-metoxy-1,4-benzoquinol methylase